MVIFHPATLSLNDMSLPAKHLPAVFLNSFKELQKNNPLRLAGATAFFTTFALPPLIIIQLQLFWLLGKKEELRGQMLNALAQIIGKEGTRQVQTIMRGMTGLAINPVAAIAGFTFLLFVATTLFKVIKDSIDELWDIKLADANGMKSQMISRVKSLYVILLAALLFIAGVFLDNVQEIIGHSVQNYSGTVAAVLVAVFSAHRHHLVLIALPAFTRCNS